MKLFLQETYSYYKSKKGDTMINAGLILEGGGMRGVYTTGALDCLIDNQILFKNIYAVSAGACHACSYVSQQRGRAYSATVNYLNDKRYASISNLLREGNYFAESFVFHEIPDTLIPLDFKALKESKMNLFSVVTNCKNGEAEYILIDDYKADVDVIRASCALPYLSRMIRLGDEYYLDGGLADAIPIVKSIESGNNKNLLILTRDESYLKSKNRASMINKIKYRKYPELVHTMNSKHTEYNNTLNIIKDLEDKDKAVIIRPKNPLGVSRLEKDTKKLKILYELGYQDAAEKIEKITTTFSNCN